MEACDVSQLPVDNVFVQYIKSSLLYANLEVISFPSGETVTVHKLFTYTVFFAMGLVASNQLRNQTRAARLDSSSSFTESVNLH